MGAPRLCYSDWEAEEMDVERRRGLSWDRIAQLHRISAPQAKRIVEDWRRRHAESDI